MQQDTIKTLGLTGCTFLSAVIVLAVSGCGANQVAVKPAEPEPISTSVATEDVPIQQEEIAVVVEETADSALIDPSPERLVLAARYGQASAVKYLLDGGMNVNAKDAYGNTALIAAASNNQTAMVEQLLSRGANVNAANKVELTALMGASVKGDYELVHHLVSVGADVNAINDDGETALFMAVQYGHYKAAKVLLNGGANPNLHNTVRANLPNSGFTPLMYTATHGLTNETVDWEVMTQLLVENGANPNLTSTHGETAMDYARNKNDAAVIAVLKRAGANDEKIYAGLNADESLLKAARIGDFIKVEKLLEQGANPNFVDDNGITPLLSAAYEGHLAVLQVLLSGNIEVNFVPSGLRQFAMSKSHAPLSERELMEAASRGETALIAAVRQGHIEAAELLLNKDAKIDLPNRHGETALFVATGAGDIKLVKVLLEKGADPNSLEQDNRRNRLAQAKHSMGKDSVLIFAVQKGQHEVSEALIEAGADVNFRGFMGKTALYVAVENSRRNLMQLLLERQADTNIESLAGISPLMEAARKGNHHMVADLLTNDANVNAIEQPELGFARETQAGGSTGMTALMFAAQGGHDDVVDQLLLAGAEINIHNSDGETAMDLASNAGYNEIVQILSSAADQGSVSLNAVEN